MNGQCGSMNKGLINHNHRFWKWVTGILGTLLVVAVVTIAGTIKQIERLQTRQDRMGEDVETNTKWIADWYAVLKVPERDQHQDSAIEELTRQYEEVTRRLRVIERRMSNGNN